MRPPSHTQPARGGSKCGCSRTGRWDPSSFRIGLDDVATPKAATRKSGRVSLVKGKFIAGPLDVAWLSQARKLGVTALWVGLSLWFLRGIRQSHSFIVSNLIMGEWEVLPDAKSRTLRKLEGRPHNH
jgi:hypothetical protein